LRREGEGRAAVAFRDQAGFLGKACHELIMRHVGAGLRLRIVHAEKHLTFVDVLSFLDQDLPDNAAFEMSDRLAVGFDGDRTRRNYGAVELGQGRPATEDAEGEDDDDVAHEGRTTPVAQGGLSGCVHVSPSLPGRWPAACGRWIWQAAADSRL